MKKITNLKQLQDIVEHAVGNNIHKSSHLQDASANIMHEVVKENIYNAFSPREYERRGDEDGFSDVGGMKFTTVNPVGEGGISISLENTNEGVNGLTGEEMTKMFEKGQTSKWEKPFVKDEEGRRASDPRPFIEDTIKEMNLSKDELVNALYKDLKSYGFNVRIGTK